MFSKLRLRNTQRFQNYSLISGQYSSEHIQGYNRTPNINTDELPRRCDSEQTHVYKTQYSQIQRYPHIIKLKRRIKENEISPNDEISLDINQLPISPLGDLYDATGDEKPRTQRYHKGKDSIDLFSLLF